MPFSITKEDYITDMAREQAIKDNRSLSNHIETLVKRNNPKCDSTPIKDQKDK